MYTYVDGMLDKRGPHRTGHLDLLKTMSEEGDCLLGASCFFYRRQLLLCVVAKPHDMTPS